MMKLSLIAFVTLFATGCSQRIYTESVEPNEEATEEEETPRDEYNPPMKCEEIEFFPVEDCLLMKATCSGTEHLRLFCPTRQEPAERDRYVDPDPIAYNLESLRELFDGFTTVETKR